MAIMTSATNEIQYTPKLMKLHKLQKTQEHSLGDRYSLIMCSCRPSEKARHRLKYKTDKMNGSGDSEGTICNLSLRHYDI